MQAGQRLVARDGYQVCLYFMSYMYITQGEGGSTSHQGTYNIDYIGWSASGRVYQAPIYAPCDVVCSYLDNSYGAGNMRVFSSRYPVHLANGTLGYMCFEIAHDDNPIATATGQTFSQGDLIGHTGTYGYVTGDHTHVSAAYGQFSGFDNTGQHQQLNNAGHQYDIFYVNDTVLTVDEGYNWRTWTEPPIPPTPTGGKFPWYIYFRKRRELWK